MAENKIQMQIDELNRKLDLVLECVNTQKQKREEIDDLIEDLNIVAKDAFRNTVVMLYKAQVDLDQCGIACLVMKFLQNISTFHEMLEWMESARDFMKDVSPILHQIGLDAISKMNELDQKGYFEYIRQAGKLADTWVQNFKPEDLQRLRESIPHLAATLRNLTDPSLLNMFQNITQAMTDVKMDKYLDDRSLWSLFKKMRSPEIRQSISYLLRLVTAINHLNKPSHFKNIQSINNSIIQ